MDYKKIIRGFKDRNVLVIGDLILDHYIWGKVNRISPEAPVPVVQVTREEFLLGGAANVAHNIVSLGGKAAVIGINGQDIAGEALMKILRHKGVDCEGIFTENRPTTVKTRVIAHNQQVVRFDREDRKYVDGKILKGVLGHVNSVLLRYDAIILSDYQKGMISSELIRDIVKKELGKADAPGELLLFEDKIDNLGLAAFDVFVECREQIYEIKANQERSKVFRAFERAGLVTEIREE